MPNCGGTGGHFSGGGVGPLSRKYGLARDNVILGEDLFWAISGGGGNSFVIVVAWKIKLVPVPSTTVTAFTVDKSLEDGITSLLHKWQHVAHMLPPEIYIVISVGAGDRYANKYKKLMDEKFPELGLTGNDFIEMSWIQSVLLLAGLPANSSTDILLNVPQKKLFFKGKSDYVRQPISQTGIELMWQRLVDDKQTALLLTLYGGRMSEISESALLLLICLSSSIIDV
ncbi:berberine bridge enzyme-like 9 [Papaver somniferum]|uniref:berberine bridge enzyme-like 9 n=1 Tax=Papaver somniferum TaxID=3469 RepID=UPI000E700BED|nr:berberine bridge enzyme-like 9 [Papaver somniferum]